VGVKQLAPDRGVQQKRTALALRYRERLVELDGIMPLSDPLYSMKHSWHLFIIRLDIDKVRLSRDAFMEELKKRNIGTGLSFSGGAPPEILSGVNGHVPRHAAEHRMELRPDLLSPAFPDMTSEDVDEVLTQ